MKELANKLLEGIAVGFKFKSLQIDLDQFQSKFTLFLRGLGIRNANKLCPG